MPKSNDKKIDVQKHDRNMQITTPELEGLRWKEAYDKPFDLAGFPWFSEDKLYRRMPVNTSGTLPKAVDNLANCTAGGQIRFQTDSKRIGLKVQLLDRANMYHMPATGQCGFDLYLGEPGKQTFHSVTRFDHTKDYYECLLFGNKTSEMRNFTINFPLYQGVKEVSVGLEEIANIQTPPPYAISKPVVVYGTSITQGGCASRPGMAYTNILSRKLNTEFINLGFSGSGKGEPEVAEIIANIPTPALFLLDYEANAGTLKDYSATLPEFIRILRAKHQSVPIVLVSKIRYAGEIADKDMRQRRESKLAFQQKLVSDLKDKGDRNIHFCNGESLLGDDFDECSVDGAHQTDLGFSRMANALKSVIEKIL